MIKQCQEVTYALRCEDGIYYVGKTTRLNGRLKDHFGGTGAQCTRRHPPIELLKVWECDVEKQMVKKGRAKYGKDKCFGYCYHEGS